MDSKISAAKGGPLVGSRGQNILTEPMSEQPWTWTAERVIPSDTAEGKRILDEVLGQLELYRWLERDIFSVHLAMEEALVNAIKHGNGLDRSKRVRVTCKMSPERVWIQVIDEGPGFELADVPDPTAAENLERPCGRGIMLMRSFMSRVEYNETGNAVVMEKQRGDPPPPSED